MRKYRILIYTFVSTYINTDIYKNIFRFFTIEICREIIINIDYIICLKKKMAS